MAVAFQEAREYWARNPDDTVNAPNEIHESIEKWLIAKRLLAGPAQTVQEEIQTSDSEEPTAPESSGKRAGFKLPRIPPLPIRRLSLPSGNSSIVLPLKSGQLRRRHTDSGTSGGSLENVESLPPVPRSPRRILRDVAVIFRPTRRKRYFAGSRHGRTTSAEPTSVHDSEDDLSSPDKVDDCHLPSCASNHIADNTSSVYEDATDAIELLLPLVDSPAPDDPPNASIDTRCDTIETTEDMSTTDAQADAAYNALMPILYELEALSEHPRLKTIASENADEDYSQFWETFAQLSAKEVLYAVYAIRSGMLDVPDNLDAPSVSSTVILLAMWALAASALSVYLYTRLP
ncbi:hypothetical protein OH77DRAFT_1593066 [Trametes cingulata]|nr:hypothetical protein OH77DRAFT_1593066 [Trametes cingulata]